MKQIKNPFRIAMLALLLIAAVAAISYSLSIGRLNNDVPPADSPVLETPLPAKIAEPPPAHPDDPETGETAEVEPEDNLPQDQLFITEERRQYQHGQLTLIIPKLDKTLPIYNGVSDAELKKGVGLYDCAQLPGTGDRNVSLAGHRNTSRGGVITDNAPFYYVDTLGEGDYLYLADAEYIYRYLYEDTKVVEASDWSPIYCQGFSCLTITSCTPIGIGSHRIVVQGRLNEIFLQSDKFIFSVSAEEKTEIALNLPL